MRNRISVSSAEFIRNIGHWQNEALRQPISITHHGRERLVLAAPDAFETAAGSEDADAVGKLRADNAALQDNLGDGYLSFDSQLSIRHSNSVAEAFVGIARADLEGAPIISTLPQPLASILCDRAQRVIRSRQVERFEVGADDGRHLAVTVFPVTDGAAALLRNITETHVLRRRLEDGEAIEQAVRVHACAASIKLDARARVESVDDSFTRWTGFAGIDLTGHRILDLVAAAWRRDCADMIESVLREAQPRSMALTLLGKRGEEIEGMLALAPILTDFVAHGAIAVFVPYTRHDQPQRTACTDAQLS
ncbi:MAG: PAS domain-containing protein [Hyphomonadaceae bacterium]